MQAMHILCDDDRVKVTVRHGHGPLCVVSFAGVGRGVGVTAIQQEEFRNSLAHRDATLVFVIDRQRTWYTDTHVLDAVSGVVDGLRAGHGIRQVVALGHSMGGSGAILAGERLGADRVLAFNPQSCMDRRRLRFEPGFERYIESLPADYPFADCCEARVERSKCLVLFGLLFGPDLGHATRFLEAGFDVRILPGCAHNVPRHLRDRGLLEPLLDCVMHASGQDVRAFVRDEIGDLERDAVDGLVRAHALHVEAVRGGHPGPVALAMAEASLRSFPHAPVFHQTHSELLAAQGRLDEAEAAVRRALDLDDAQALFHHQLSLVLLRKGHLGPSLDAARRAVERRPDWEPYHRFLACLHTAAGDTRSAKRSLAAALALAG